MLYELHLTTNRADLPVWEGLCEQHNAKPLWIFLSEGEHPRQMMMAITEDHLNFTTALKWATNLKKLFHGTCPIIRAKLEAPLDKVVGTPFEQTVMYYEVHLKLLLDPDTVSAVESLCKAHQFGLSWNTLSEKKGLMNYYITRRIKTESAHTAANYFRETFSFVGNNVSVPVRMEMEAVLLDTWKDLDRGWCEV